MVPERDVLRHGPKGQVYIYKMYMDDFEKKICAYKNLEKINLKNDKIGFLSLFVQEYVHVIISIRKWFWVLFFSKFIDPFFKLIFVVHFNIRNYVTVITCTMYFVSISERFRYARDEMGRETSSLNV